MIYFTTFIFTLLLAHIARAVPTCGDVASPEDMYNPTYNNEQLPVVLANNKVTPNTKYDDPNGDTRTVTCSYLAPRYPHFRNFPHFPYIGASYDIQRNSSNCFKCWKLTRKSGISIYFLAINSVDHGFQVSKFAYDALSGGNYTFLVVDADPVSLSYCNPNTETN